MAVSAMLCGMDSFSDIKDFCDWLCEWIKMPNGVPRAHTFSNIFAIIEPDLFNHCLPEHIGALHPILKRQIIVIDGERIRGSHGLDTEACLDQIANKLFPAAGKIVLVMDNLNTHREASLYETFAPEKARAL